MKKIASRAFPILAVLIVIGAVWSLIATRSKREEIIGLLGLPGDECEIQVLFDNDYEQTHDLGIRVKGRAHLIDTVAKNIDATIIDSTRAGIAYGFELSYAGIIGDSNELNTAIYIAEHPMDTPRTHRRVFLIPEEKGTFKVLITTIW